MGGPVLSGVEYGAYFKYHLHVWFAATTSSPAKSEVEHAACPKATMRSGHAARLLACALIGTAVCFLVPFKLSRDSSGLVAVDQPAHLTCSGAPVRKASSWLPGKPGALRSLHADEKTVARYVKKCIADLATGGKDAKASRATVGIVIPAGGKAMLSSTLAVATLLRETLKSSLPLEVVYNGPEEHDAPLISQLQVGVSCFLTWWQGIPCGFPVSLPVCLGPLSHILALPCVPHLV